MKQSLILLIAASAFLCGCNILNPTTSQKVADKAASADRAVIKKLLEDNISALNAGDPSALGRYYEDDAIQFPPNSPALIGWDAIRSTLEKELNGIKLATTIDVVEIFTADTWAFTRCTYRIVTTPQGGGQPTVATGNWLNILRRQPDDSWKIARSIWTSEEQPDVTAPSSINSKKNI
jgi:uncharacterized protein (TIGR02246 family)